MSDGALIASTRRGQVWRVDNPNAKNPDDAIFTLMCEGLHESLGLAVVNDEIFVMQRSELSKLIDLDGDHIIDEIQTITQDWGMSGNYHEFAFGLPVDHEGNMFISLNVGFWNPHWWHGKSRAPYRGWVLKVAPDGEVTPLAGGLRSPAGLGLLEDGTLLVTDNQGDWMPVCPIYAITKGDFYGHPASLRWYENQPNDEPSDTQPPDVERAHPLLWIPYMWSRSTGNIIQDNTGGAFGPFEGQYFVAELTNGQILRASFETIDGVQQGACWLSHQRIGSVYHIEFDAQGTMFVGMTNRGWGGLSPSNGIARIRHTGKTPFEMKDIHLQRTGFNISFTKPVATIAQVIAQKYDYNWWWEYGSPQQHVEALEVLFVDISQDGMSADIVIDGLESGTCVHLILDGAVSVDNTPLLHDEVSYTINKMPSGSLKYVAKRVEPPIDRGQRVEGWIYLSWADAFDLWINDGVYTCNAELDRDDPTQFIISDGNGALVAHEGKSMETSFDMTDGEFRMNFMLAEDGHGIVDLPVDASILLVDDKNGTTGSVVDRNGTMIVRSTVHGYLGAGIWHTMIVKYQASPATIHSVEINGVHVVQNVEIQGTPSPSPIRIASTRGDIAFGDVRVKQITGEISASGWEPMSIGSDWTTDGNVTVDIADDGTIVIDGGVGTAQTTTSIHTISAIRFDVKIEGIGHCELRIGGVAFDIATYGDRKTGSITNHPIRTNLIDQNEWCTIELRSDHGTTLLLNDIPLLQTDEPLLLNSDVITVVHRDAKVQLRREYTQ